MAVTRMKLQWAVVAAFIVATAVAQDGPKKNNHEVLGITRAATFEDIQYAYQKMTRKHIQARPSNYQWSQGSGLGRQMAQPQDWFVAVHHAYEAIGNKDMQEDSLRFVGYWDDIVRVVDDFELRKFTEFQTGGSAKLRMLVVMASPEDMHYEAYAASIKFSKRVRVGQIAQAETLTPQGEAGEFLKSLKLRDSLPAVVIFDPITRGMKVRYGLDGISAELERLLQGGMADANKIGGLLEFDADGYADRCQIVISEEGEDDKEPCNPMFVIATSAELEPRRSDLVQALKPYTEACREIQAECFWLRLGRGDGNNSPRVQEWQNRLRAIGTGEAEIQTFAFSDFGGSHPGSVMVAPATVVAGSAKDIQGWFETVLGGEADGTNHPFASWPQVPLPSIQEPLEDDNSKKWRQVKYHVQCVFYKDCRAMQLDQGHVFLQMFLRRYGYETQYVQFMEMDLEMKIAAVGAIMLFLMLVFGICKSRLCPRRALKGSEEYVVSNMEFLVPIALKRTAGQKFGIGICNGPNGGLKVTGVDDGGLLHAWNMQQTEPHMRIQEGDVIVFASGNVGGKPVRETVGKKIVKVLQTEEANIIVERNRNDPQLQRVVGTCILENMALKGNVELKPAEGSQVPAMEVASLGPAVQQWNEFNRSQGKCCTQSLQVGDRIVSVNSNTNVQSQEGVESGALVVVRWCAAGRVQPHRVEVSMEKTTPEDKWGMQIRRRVAEPRHMEVLEVVGSGLLAQWNAIPGQNQIFKGDRIIKANGLEEITAITNALQEPKLTLTFERLVDSMSPGPTAAAAPVTAPGTFGTVAAPGGVLPPVAASPMFPPVQAPNGNGVAAPNGNGMMPPAQMQAQMSPAPMAPMVPQAASMAPRAPLPPPMAPTAPAFRQQGPQAFAAAPGSSSSGALGALALAIVFVAVVVAVATRGEMRTDAQGQLSPEVQNYLNRIKPELHREVAALLLFLGGVLTLVFVRNEVRSSGGVFQQVCISMFASMLLGFGSFFLLAWAGVYASV